MAIFCGTCIHSRPWHDGTKLCGWCEAYRKPCSEAQAECGRYVSKAQTPPENETIPYLRSQLTVANERIKELEEEREDDKDYIAQLHNQRIEHLAENTRLQEGLEYYKDPEKLARLFHSLYESFSQLTGWMTQAQCHTQFDSLPEENKKAMLKTCHVIAAIARQTLEGKDE